MKPLALTFAAVVLTGCAMQTGYGPSGGSSGITHPELDHSDPGEIRISPHNSSR